MSDNLFEGTQLLVQPCGCGAKDCETFVIAMIRPVIKPLDGTDELVSMVYFPDCLAGELIAKIREMVALKRRNKRARK